MTIVLEKDFLEHGKIVKKYVLKVYSHLDKVVQLTDKKEQALNMNSKSYAEWFIGFMKLQGFNIKTR
jgi:hypothetical protein